jgi:glycosyltransferase involved in cell wall biosynthesis
LPPDRLFNVHFGVDHEYFSPTGANDDGYVLAVGRDAGRDWSTFLEAIGPLPARVKIACRQGALAGYRIPANVEVLGWVDRQTYRHLLDRAAVVVVASKPLDYPTGQSVTLEAMAMGRACVVTRTAAMSEYVVDGETAVLVRPGDAGELRVAVSRLLEDSALRHDLGRRARQSVESCFTARAMWARIAQIASADPSGGESV